MPADLTGAALARRFFVEAVEPVLSQHFPTLRYSAGLVGVGSEVLGFDDATSRDHDWGPRCHIFVDCATSLATIHDVHDCLARMLPRQFCGYSTHFGVNTDGTGRLEDAAGHEAIVHRVRVTTWAAYTLDYAGYDLSQPLGSKDWLAIPMQKLRTLAHSAAHPWFRDDLDLETHTRALQCYPDDVRRAALCALWRVVQQDEHLMGRCGMRGDELGAALIAGRLARVAMHMAFVLERQYAPYTKWLGTAFGRLALAPVLQPLLLQLCAATDAAKREEAHVAVFGALIAAMRAEPGLVRGALPAAPVLFHTRPMRVWVSGPGEDTVCAALRAAMTDDVLLEGLSKVEWFGPLEAMTADTDVMCCTGFAAAYRRTLAA